MRISNVTRDEKHNMCGKWLVDICEKGEMCGLYVICVREIFVNGYSRHVSQHSPPQQP